MRNLAVISRRAVVQSTLDLCRVDFNRNEKAALREAVGGWVDKDSMTSPELVQRLRHALHVEALG